MGFPTILACVLAGFASAATSIGASIGAPEQPENFFCGTGQPPQDLVQFHRQLNLNQMQSLQHRAPYDDDDDDDDDDFRARKWKWKPVTVPVYHHVLYSEKVCPLMTATNLMKQMQVLNYAFKPAGFQFEQKAATWRKVPEWATNAEARREQGGMHEQLRTGDYGTLNVYWIETGNAFVSYPTTAWRDGLQPHHWSHDGVVLPCDFAVGTPHRGWTLGKALVHLVGHWNGLLHTSSAECADEGDHVSDTPAALVTRGGCNVTLDTCPDQPGLDPVHNYMSESDNECMTEFTPGQIQRMHTVWEVFRAAQRSTSLIKLHRANPSHVIG
ncbi:hypothetical protein C2857_003010 [Epichloe festucae Fl1]|uniref:Peptidase M43 pregnancy-associated plasma-A domain-containing protein n=1 Tax=Epichloe festucae (strain Fl1) TaxID=877507 RepID=A0A7S9PV38_EPIFF|nr:hypothetical protein C2857_003010 [Epichloe festucae Fl1]